MVNNKNTDLHKFKFKFKYFILVSHVIKNKYTFMTYNLKDLWDTFDFIQ